MCDVIAHKWMQGAHASADVIKEEFKKRKAASVLKKKQERAKIARKKLMRAQKKVGRKDKVCHDLTQEQQESSAKHVSVK